MSTPRPPWPEGVDPPDAASLIAYFVGQGQFSYGLIDGYVNRGAFTVPPDPLLWANYMRAVGRMIGAHDVVTCLKALVELDPAAADKAASTVWGMADAGDCYGEAFWEWCTDLKLDAEALRSEGEAAAKNHGSG